MSIYAFGAINKTSDRQNLYYFGSSLAELEKAKEKDLVLVS